MTFIFILAASLFASLSNLFFRRNTSQENSVSAYLAIFYFSSFFLSFLINPEIFVTDLNLTILFIGAAVGIANVLLMFFTAKALMTGPTALTFAFQNVSAIFPGLLLFLLFGSEFGFSITFFQLIGISLVIMGLFFGVKLNQDSQITGKWLRYALACLSVQVLALSLMQARCILFECSTVDNSFSSWSINKEQDVWFMPGQFGAAFLVQLILSLREKKGLKRQDFLNGSLGGLSNGMATCLLLLSTKIALPYEKLMLFPCFAVGIIIFCNVWATKLYKEKFHFATNTICALGILFGSLKI